MLVFGNFVFCGCFALCDTFGQGEFVGCCRDRSAIFNIGLHFAASLPCGAINLRARNARGQFLTEVIEISGLRNDGAGSLAG